MKLDFSDNNVPSRVYEFRTPKPLVFIVKLHGFWEVYVLNIAFYLDEDKRYYYKGTFDSYFKARNVFKKELEIFYQPSNIKHFKNWATK